VIVFFLFRNVEHKLYRRYFKTRLKYDLPPEFRNIQLIDKFRIKFHIYCKSHHDSLLIALVCFRVGCKCFVCKLEESVFFIDAL